MSVYEARTNSDGNPCVHGPGTGLGYHAGTLFAELTCKTTEEAERAAKIAEIAHAAGMHKARDIMCKAMGL